MLIASGGWECAEHHVRAILVLDRRILAHLIERHELLYDSRYAAPTPHVRDIATVFVTLSGGFSSADQVVAGPCLHLLAENEFESVGADAQTIRSWGAPCEVLAIRAARSDVIAPVGVAHGPMDVPTELLARIDAFRNALDPGERAEGFRAILETLSGMGVLRERVARELTRDEPPHLQRVWEALASLYNRHDTATYIDLVSSIVGLSPRQVRRDVRELSEHVGFSGFRSTVKLLRLRRAVLLLSGPALSISDVAGVVGYGSTDAMGRAFRDAGLPAPSVVREAVLYDARPAREAAIG